MISINLSERSAWRGAAMAAAGARERSWLGGADCERVNWCNV